MLGVITHALMRMMIKDGLNHHEQVLLSDEDSFLMGTTGPDIFTIIMFGHGHQKKG